MLGDGDGDGILDAEELMPLHVSVRNLKDANPPRYSKRYSGTDYADTYGMLWSNWGTESKGKEYHDIDMDTDDDFMTEAEKQAAKKFNERYVYNEKFLCLDPTEADTDGDGVPDGVEVTDDHPTGIFDSEGNQLGRWPDDKEFCKLTDGTFDYSQSTNPLNPSIK